MFHLCSRDSTNRTFKNMRWHSVWTHEEDTITAKCRWGINLVIWPFMSSASPPSVCHVNRVLCLCCPVWRWSYWQRRHKPTLKLKTMFPVFNSTIVHSRSGCSDGSCGGSWRVLLLFWLFNKPQVHETLYRPTPGHDIK